MKHLYLTIFGVLLLALALTSILLVKTTRQNGQLMKLAEDQGEKLVTQASSLKRQAEIMRLQKAQLTFGELTVANLKGRLSRSNKDRETLEIRLDQANENLALYGERIDMQEAVIQSCGVPQGGVIQRLKPLGPPATVSAPLRCEGQFVSASGEMKSANYKLEATLGL